MVLTLSASGSQCWQTYFIIDITFHTDDIKSYIGTKVNLAFLVAALSSSDELLIGLHDAF